MAATRAARLLSSTPRALLPSNPQRITNLAFAGLRDGCGGGTGTCGYGTAASARRVGPARQPSCGMSTQPQRRKGPGARVGGGRGRGGGGGRGGAGRGNGPSNSNSGRGAASAEGERSKRPLLNSEIQAATVRLVTEADPEAGIEKQIQEVSRREALQLARERGLDLVCVAPHMEPPVCRLMDWRSEHYKRVKMAKARKEEGGGGGQQAVKQVQFRGAIDSHDFEMKLARVRRYLDRGDQVHISFLAGRKQLWRNENCLGDLETKLLAALPSELYATEVVKPINPVMRREYRVTCPKRLRGAATKAGSKGEPKEQFAAVTDDDSEEEDNGEEDDDYSKEDDEPRLVEALK